MLQSITFYIRTLQSVLMCFCWQKEKLFLNHWKFVCSQFNPWLHVFHQWELTELLQSSNCLSTIKIKGWNEDVTGSKLDSMSVIWDYWLFKSKQAHMIYMPFIMQNTCSQETELWRWNFILQRLKTELCDCYGNCKIISCSEFKVKEHQPWSGCLILVSACLDGCAEFWEQAGVRVSHLPQQTLKQRLQLQYPSLRDCSIRSFHHALTDRWLLPNQVGLVL